MEKWHQSVLLDETVSSLGEIRGGRFADLTFGEGGHTEALLNRGAAEVIGVDRDREAIDRYLESGALKDDKRLKLLHGNLSSFPDVPLAAPLTIYGCHCTSCQKQSGSAFGTSMLVPRDGVSYTHATPATWTRTAENGRKIECFFCGTCGTRLVQLPQHSPTLAIIRAGTLDDTSDVHLIGHIWIRSKQPWFQVPAGAVTYEQQPPDLTRLIEAYAARRA